MYLGKTLFAQIMDFLPWRQFHRIVARRKGDHYVKHFACAEQFRVKAFAQLSYRESLRDIELCLGAQASKLFHMGLSQPAKCTTLAEANERRDWRLFAEFAQCLIDEARGLFAAEPFGIDLAGSVYAFDASTIELCLSLFPWAHVGRDKSAKASIKLHTLLDLRGNIPSFIHLSTGRMADVRGLDKLSLEPGAIYVMDLQGALAGGVVLQACPELVEGWIKPHLRIKKFYGTTENAVKSQIWIAVSIHVLTAIIKKRLKLRPSLYGLLQQLSLTLLEKTTLQAVLQGATAHENDRPPANQLNLFEF